MTKDEKLQEYESIIKEITDGKQEVATVMAGPDGYNYRLQTAGGNDIIGVVHPSLTRLAPIKVGASVINVEGLITRVLPEQLVIKEEPVDFTRISWDEIGGMQSQLERIKNAVEGPMKHDKLYKEFGLSPMKGILLYGPPGCGKTLIAKAIASMVIDDNDADSFSYLKGGELLSPYVGMAEKHIKDVFESARNYSKRKKKRAVIFIDEAEAIVPQRGSRKSSDVDTTIVPTFLAEMDGFTDNSPLVILATNYPHQLDEAIQRPGRIDLKIEVARPTEADAVDIFKIHLKKTKLEDSIDTLSRDAAKAMYSSGGMTTRASGALIATTVNAAINNAVQRRIAGGKLAKKKGVTKEDLTNAIKEL